MFLVFFCFIFVEDIMFFDDELGFFVIIMILIIVFVIVVVVVMIVWVFLFLKRR